MAASLAKGDTMKTLEAIETRRAVKHDSSNHRMPEEGIEQLMSLTLQAPTAFNIVIERTVR